MAFQWLVFITKPLLMPILLWYFTEGLSFGKLTLIQKRMITALTLAWIGDIVNLYSQINHWIFMAGVIIFLAMQIMYIIICFYLIAERTKNWEVDRIALSDMIMLKMAVTEVLKFDQIPVKVTLNEYIDISKDYSTPQSKVFINGVLDKIVEELRKQDKVKKTGRGLVEN